MKVRITAVLVFVLALLLCESIYFVLCRNFIYRHQYQILIRAHPRRKVRSCCRPCLRVVVDIVILISDRATCNYCTSRVMAISTYLLVTVF